jgi:hypothetical protein
VESYQSVATIGLQCALIIRALICSSEQVQMLDTVFRLTDFMGFHLSNLFSARPCVAEQEWKPCPCSTEGRPRGSPFALEVWAGEDLDELCFGVAFSGGGAGLLAPALLNDLVMPEAITGFSAMCSIFSV